MKENKLSHPLPVTAWLHKSPEPLLGKLVFFMLRTRTKAPHVPCRSLMPNSDLITIWIAIREPRCLTWLFHSWHHLTVQTDVLLQNFRYRRGPLLQCESSLQAASHLLWCRLKEWYWGIKLQCCCICFDKHFHCILSSALNTMRCDPVKTGLSVGQYLP